MRQEIISPSLAKPEHNFVVFLAGSIEMDAAEDWQKQVSDHFEEDPITFFNPRREKWEKKWKQSIDDKNFVEQVEWELQRLEQADIVFMHFEPGTKSPISLLEFGMYVKSNPEKLVVSCPDGFWRKGNVEVTARMYNVKVHHTLEAAMKAIKSIAKSKE